VVVLVGRGPMTGARAGDLAGPPVQFRHDCEHFSFPRFVLVRPGVALMAPDPVAVPFFSLDGIFDGLETTVILDRGLVVGA
jgi:hypothetical protein